MTTYLNKENIKYLIVHCSATKNDYNIGFKEINDMHKARGFRMYVPELEKTIYCGYHKIIRRDANENGEYIEDGRPLNIQGAQAKGYNSKSIGICLIGGVDDNIKPEAEYTIPQHIHLKKLLHELLEIFPNSKVIGHNQVANKWCPCFYAEKWWDVAKNRDYKEIPNMIDFKNYA